MEFLKRHYEKLILLVLLLAFILSMVYVLRIIDQTKEITEESLQIPTRAADYEVHDPKAAEFEIADYWQSRNANWPASQARNKANPFFSDLVVTFPMARCPGEDKKPCGKIIPLYYFTEEQPCPFCGLELKKPPKRTAEEGQLFLNNIQLTQEEATRFRLNVEDALLDRDNDGFSNIFEIRVAKTSPVDPRSHSPMWYRLRLQEIRRVELPIKFMAVNTNNSDDKSRWDLQLNMVNKRNREITSIEAVGNTIELDNKTYKIADVKLVKREIPAETKGGTPRISDESVMYLEQVEGTDKLELQVGKKVFSSRPKAIMKDVGVRDGMIICDIGERFRMGLRTTGFTNYRVKEIDAKAMTVTLENPSAVEGDTTLDPAGRKMVVTKKGMIPDEMLVNFENEQLREDGMGMAPRGGY